MGSLERHSVCRVQTKLQLQQGSWPIWVLHARCVATNHVVGGNNKECQTFFHGPKYHPIYHHRPRCNQLAARRPEQTTTNDIGITSTAIDACVHACALPMAPTVTAGTAEQQGGQRQEKQEA